MSFSKLTPVLMVENVERTVRFYKSILGFEILMSLPVESDEPFWALIKNGTVEIIIQSRQSLGGEYPCLKNSQPGSNASILYINTDNIKTLFARIDKKVKVLKNLQRTCYGTEEFTIMDCNNCVITFAQDMKL